MKEYNNIKELEKDYPELAIKAKEHFKNKSLENTEIILSAKLREDSTRFPSGDESLFSLISNIFFDYLCRMFRNSTNKI